MIPTLVLDACAIIALVRAGVLRHLRVIYRSVATTPEVQQECGSCAGEVSAVIAEGWFSAQKPSTPTPVTTSAGGRERGDWSVLFLAAQLGVPLATDDLKLRARAKARGVPVVGALEILVVLKRAGLIQSVRECITRMEASGEGIGEEDRRKALVAAGESP